jgi:branched-chain amino acid transport system substrate-binding protein
MRKFWLIGVLCVSVLCMGITDIHADDIKVGAILRLSTGASDGLPAKRGIEIAVKEINAAGGIKGKPLTVIYEDSKDSPQVTVSAFQKLTSMDKVQVVIGPMTSGETLAVAPIAQSNHILVLTPTGTSPKISDAGEYIYRGCTRIDKQAEFLTKYAKDVMKATKVAVLYSNEPYGKGCNDVFTKYFKDLGIPVVVAESFMVGDRDFSSQITKIKQSQFDLIFIPGYLQETAPAISQVRKMGITAPSIGVYGDMAPKYIELAGKAAEGHVNASEYNEDYNTPANKKFKKEYFNIVKTTPNEPNNIMFAAITYDMTKLVAKGLSEKGDNADGVRAYLDNVKDFDGVTGKLSFDKNGDVIKQGVYLFKVVKGKYIKVQ